MANDLNRLPSETLEAWAKRTGQTLHKDPGEQLIGPCPAGLVTVEVRPSASKTLHKHFESKRNERAAQLLTRLDTLAKSLENADDGRFIPAGEIEVKSATDKVGLMAHCVGSPLLAEQRKHFCNQVMMLAAEVRKQLSQPFDPLAGLSDAYVEIGTTHANGITEREDGSLVVEWVDVEESANG